MKKHLFPFALMAMVLISPDLSNHPINRKQTVNPILGDISFISKFGYHPDGNTSEVLRIKTHLEYAEYLLRNRAVPGITAEQLQKRLHLLNLLHQYLDAGVFPRNYDYADQRKPCFIDKDGGICAVGYLVEQTAGREVAEQINKKYKYEELLAINDVSLDSWIEGSGFTKEEFAIIQPAYGPPTYTAKNHISTGYGISSSVLGGINLSLSTANAIHLSRGTQNKKLSIAGLISGVSQVILGATSIPKAEPGINGNYFLNKSQKSLSYANIGIGATSMILNAANLVINRKPSKEKKVGWGVYGFPTQGNNLGMTFSLTTRL